MTILVLHYGNQNKVNLLGCYLTTNNRNGIKWHELLLREMMWHLIGALIDQKGEIKIERVHMGKPATRRLTILSIKTLCPTEH